MSTTIGAVTSEQLGDITMNSNTVTNVGCVTDMTNSADQTNAKVPTSKAVVDWFSDICSRIGITIGKWLKIGTSGYVQINDDASSPHIRSSGTTGSIVVSGGTNSGNGATLSMYGKDTNNGRFVLKSGNADDTGANYSLEGAGSKLTWGGSNIVRKINNRGADDKGNVSLTIPTAAADIGAMPVGGVYRNNQATGVAIGVGSDNKDGSYIAVAGNATGGDYDNSFTCNAGGAIGGASLFGRVFTELVDGENVTRRRLQWSGKDIVRSVCGKSADVNGNVYLNASNDVHAMPNNANGGLNTNPRSAPITGSNHFVALTGGNVNAYRANGGTGARLVLFGDKNTNTDVNGRFEACATNDTLETRLNIYPDGRMQIAKRNASGETSYQAIARYVKVNNNDTKDASIYGLVDLSSSVVSKITVNGTTKTSISDGAIDLGSLAAKVTVNGSEISPSSGTIALGALAAKIKVNNVDKTPSSGTIDIGSLAAKVKVNGSEKSPAQNTGLVDLGNLAAKVKVNGSEKSPSSGTIDIGALVKAIKVSQSTTKDVDSTGTIDISDSISTLVATFYPSIETGMASDTEIERGYFRDTASGLCVCFGIPRVATTATTVNYAFGSMTRKPALFCWTQSSTPTITNKTKTGFTVKTGSSTGVQVFYIAIGFTK